MLLAANQPDHFYRGGESIAKFRGLPLTNVYRPEDWVGSTTTLFGTDVGRTTLPDGTLLADAIAADPLGYLGADHVAAFGTDTGLLVKLLDAGERLPVHLHPDKAFASTHLGCTHGKTEAWLIVGTSVPSPEVYLGFREEMPAATLRDLVQEQGQGDLLASLVSFPVAVGDVVFVPAGTPHAIGAGVFIVELQEPTDLSIMLEFARYGFDGSTSGSLGLGFEKALDCVDLSAWGADRVAEAHGPGWLPDGTGRKNVLPPAAAQFFRAERTQATPDAPVELEPSFAIVIAVDGTGMLGTESGAPLELSKGQTVLVPYGSGACTVTGDLTLLRCLPPSAVPAPGDRW